MLRRNRNQKGIRVTRLMDFSIFLQQQCFWLYAVQWYRGDDNSERHGEAMIVGQHPDSRRGSCNDNDNGSTAGT